MLDQETLLKLVCYDPETGIFTWISREETSYQIKNWNKIFAGKPILGRDSNGYVRISTRVNGKNKNYAAHRLAWLYIYGEWPNSDIDHINRIKSDNRISNLRLANDSLNHHNKGLSRNNTSGVKGVRWLKRDKKWRAVINCYGKPVHLGVFNNIEDAENSYIAASIQYAKDFSIHFENRI
jgi:hypothetical protein